MRRRRLGDLYNQEIEQWRRECLAKIETPADRKARIMEKAYALRDAREKARLEQVKKKLDDQWRDSCDDARTLDSKATLKFMNDERIRQIQEKKERKQLLSKQEDQFLEEWNRQLEELAKRDQQKADYRHRIDRDTTQGIRNQVRSLPKNVQQTQRHGFSFFLFPQMQEKERLREKHYTEMRRDELDELTRVIFFFFFLLFETIFYFSEFLVEKRNRPGRRSSTIKKRRRSSKRSRHCRI
jgi:hypothetical protein